MSAADPQTTNKIKSPKVDRKSVTSPTPTSSKQKVHKNFPATKPLRLRIVLVGDEQTGKSCLIKRYCEKRFVTKYLPTIGIDYGATKIYVDKREVRIHIFDTSGNPLFVEVRNEFYKDAHGILMVFDITKRHTFESLSRWLAEIEFQLKSDFDVKPVVLICGNKIEMRSNGNGNADTYVDDYEAKLWADVHGFTYCEASASTGQGVGDMFHTFFSQIVKQQVELDRAGSLPRTPASARRVTPIVNRRSYHAMSPPRELPSNTKLPLPSADQQAVMARLGRGQNAWEQLGLDKGCSKEEVNKAYRKLAIMLHPDKTAVKGADEAFKLLGMARRTILNSFAS